MYKINICAFVFSIIFMTYELNSGAALLSSGRTNGVHPGKAVYDEYCLSCHQADGRGVPGMNPPISKTEWVTGDKVRLINILLKGLKTPLTINGEEYHNPMPSHAFLSDQQIADVLSYIRSGFGNKASVVKADEVRQVRSQQ